ncbi:hypothetical protein [Dehalococcoides mccartyi]|uniref:Reductive dehalogenase anchoring protein n=2 Tax=Dehalococcoides mccartyi TaxID=61435 RepID=A0A2J1DVQ9_9CHLR|nr:hypothetical protein [Dehalococcoides mccartyi]PKH46204.1 hypothetical protein CVH13_01212 [Dehalococcoides mccartyi]CAI83525.1 putative reductive dehalogenase anchoring protein [Dehalococcoides mccartyi CBDB1]
MLLFLLTLVGGFSIIGAIFVFQKVLASKGFVVQWWFWVMAAISALCWVLGFAWLGAQLAEGNAEIGAYTGFGILVGISIVLILVNYRLASQAKYVVE